MDSRDDETKTHHRILIPITSNTMQRPNRPSDLTLHSTPQTSSASSKLTTASPSSPRLPKTAPCAKPSLPRLAIQPATGTSPRFASPPPAPHSARRAGSALSVSHRGSTSSLSSFTGGDPPSPRDDTEGSNETIRGAAAAAAAVPETASIQQSEYDDGSYDGRSETQPLNRYLAARSPAYGSMRRASLFGSPERAGKARTVESSVMHGVWLALQCCVFLLAFGILISMTIWKSSRSDSEFWGWIWTVTQPILVGLTISTFGLLIIHELRGLSTVILLYLQSAILITVTITCLSLSAHSFGQGSVGVQAAVLGCAVTLWGWSVLSFLRVALVWRVEAQREGGCDYAGLFAP